MKYYVIILLIAMNLPCQSMNEMPPEDDQRTTSYKSVTAIPHQNRLPTCSDILECLSCCCHATYVLACLSMQDVFDKYNDADHAQKRERPNDKHH